MIKNIVVVASGKGGVGKSTISVNLATSLAKKKIKVGLLDADIYGPSIPKMLGITDKPNVSKNKKILPYDKFGLKSMSIGNMVPQDGSVIWRGAMASNAIRQLVNDVEWGDLDYLFIDLPPGTGDIQLSLCQSFSISGAVIVSTPQEISLLDVRKAINMFKKVNVDIIGMIQNMSYFENSGKKNYIFGEDGVKKESEKLNFYFLGEVPILKEIANSCDIGKPISFVNKKVFQNVFEEISENFLNSMSKIKQKTVKIES